MSRRLARTTWPSRPARRRWLAPEVVQTSSMDCGPAALKCLLEGSGIPVSYGRLREACQTGVDGTSIDTIEDVAGTLGLPAEQVLVPRDFICGDGPEAFPALVVVRHADAFTHFVVVWARHGNLLQVMDPAVGRRWIPVERFEDQIFQHEVSVEAGQWRSWCESEDFAGPMRRRMKSLGMKADEADGLMGEAAAYPGWFGFGALDASVRLAQTLVGARGLARGAEASRLTAALLRDTLASEHHIHAVIPSAYWSARPDLANMDPTRQMLRISGGVMLRGWEKGGNDAGQLPRPVAELPPELAAALTPESERPWRRVVSELRAIGALHSGRIAAVIMMQSLVVVIQALLLRGLLEIALDLSAPLQRAEAVGVLLVVALGAALVEVALGARALQLGRRLDVRFRQALLAKLPRLADRYFQSRPITDMADRNHNIHLVRSLPPLALRAGQVLCDLILTFAALVLLAPGSAGWAVALVAAGLLLPALSQPLLNERDLALRNHAGALHGFYLDALLGLAPIRAHRAQGAVARQHEGLLTQWARTGRRLAAWALGAEALQSLICTALLAALLATHFAAQGRIGGGDLLLVFWALRLPAAATAAGQLARQLPMIRNALLRQLEPLCAPDDEVPGEAAPATARCAAADLRITGGAVLAGGHPVLRGIDLHLAPGEHVAVVGRSGAGKSSLLGLFLGWHRLSEGDLRVDGEPLAGAALAQLRRDTAWVDPQVQLWNSPLLDNLTYAVDAPDLVRVRELLEAADLAALTGRLSAGLQTPLGEGGSLVSGGEGQRVRLGRALLSSPVRLALLDEPFRGLDRSRRAELMQAARGWWSKATLLCATHDIAETLAFPRVLVVEDGEIVEDGEPAGLLRERTRFRALWEAERQVLRHRWSAAEWRRWQVGAGAIRETAVPGARAA